MLNQKLAALRNEKKNTQQEISIIIGVTRPAYTAYEKGTRTPDYNLVVKLADYFEVSVDYLLGRTDNRNLENEFNPISEISHLIKEYRMECSRFHEIDRWKAMGPEEMKELEKYFTYITDMAMKKQEYNK